MTAMGVFWSITILVLLLGASGAMKQYIGQNVTVASNSAFMFVFPTSHPFKGYPAGRFWSFDTKDLARVAHSVEGVEVIIPNSNGVSGESIRRNNREFESEVKGQYPINQEISSVKILQGRYINEIDMQRARKVALIGSSLYYTLFPDGGDATGERIFIGGDAYTVIGVMERVGDMMSFGESIEDSIYIPYTTMVKRYNLRSGVNGLSILVDEEYNVEEVQERLLAKLKSIYNIAPEDNKAIYCFNSMEVFALFKGLFLGLDILIWIIGLGTLFAGVVGISNIMLIVLKERTQEVGVRRALGATPIDIISQILTESFLLTMVSGVIAMAFAVGVLSIVDSIVAMEGISVQVSFNEALLSAVIIIVGGLFAGVIPATRAVSIKAVDAIREE